MEAGILYTAVFENEHTKQYHPERLLQFPNLLEELCPDRKEMEPVVRICDVSDKGCMVYNDLTCGQLAVIL